MLKFSINSVIELKSGRAHMFVCFLGQGFPTQTFVYCVYVFVPLFISMALLCLLPPYRVLGE